MSSEKSWWKKSFQKEESRTKVDALKDLQAIQETLKEAPAEIKLLAQELQKLEELEKERIMARENVLLINLEAQAAVLDKLLERYQFLQDDIDINGIRLQEISQEFLKHAEKAGLKNLVKEKKKKAQWQWG